MEYGKRKERKKKNITNGMEWILTKNDERMNILKLCVWESLNSWENTEKNGLSFHCLNESLEKGLEKKKKDQKHFFT